MKPTKSRPVLALLLVLVGCGDPQVSNIPNWQAPDAYEFTVDSACGERALIGRFHVVVEDGSVVEAEGLDDAAIAKAEGAEIVEVQATEDGRPSAIDINWDTDAIDDEACYRITDYSAGS